MEIKCEHCDKFTRHDAIDSLLQQRAALRVERDRLVAAAAKDREQLGRALDKQAEYLRQCGQLVEERDTLRAEAARLREALKTLNHAAKVVISREYGSSFDEETPLVIRLLDGTCDAADAALAVHDDEIANMLTNEADRIEKEAE